ncbi:threonine synthase [Anaerolinea thermolimosa]|uniref:threonine synthase n=1 Tax=Anaerolinea thermolimosa TaxID=229919 RepID=UPI0009FFADF7|nr:threonine synthase [Anaerolinea thermolimosa]
MDFAFTRDWIDRAVPGLWRYHKALPVPLSKAITFQEGMTPLTAFPVDDRAVYLKHDHLFQTGSYKDRGASVLVSHIQTLGIRSVVEDSSGNAGCAIAAYCAKANITCEIFVPEKTAPAKLSQLKMYGALVRKIPGSREETASAVHNAAKDKYYASHCWNAFFFQGTKTFAYEVWEQLGGRVPDVLVLPVGNGTLLLGAYIGFSELFLCGVIQKLPRIIGVQSAACNPLERMFQYPDAEFASTTWQDTLAEGIAIARPVRAKQILQALKDSRGTIVSVSDDEIKAALIKLGKMGLYIEPTGAAAMAALNQAIQFSSKKEIIVIALTGHGLKAFEKLDLILHHRS